MLNILLECFAEVIGGLAAAAVVTAAAWTLFKIIHRPEWGGPIVVIAMLVAARGIPHSPFLQMMTFFLIIASLALWWEGGEWRKRRKIRHMFNSPPHPLLDILLPRPSDGKKHRPESSNR